MGRSAEFGSGADYGREINLSTKVSDHPFYGQSGPFHEPDQPMSPTCLHCGAGRGEHSSIHLPPTREGYAAMQRMVEDTKTERREASGQAARESDQQDKAKASPYGLGGNRALRRHLAEKHEMDPDDAKEMERPAYFHRKWHTMGEYNPDGHQH